MIYEFELGFGSFIHFRNDLTPLCALSNIQDHLEICRAFIFLLLFLKKICREASKCSCIEYNYCNIQTNFLEVFNIKIKVAAAEIWKLRIQAQDENWSQRKSRNVNAYKASCRRRWVLSSSLVRFRWNKFSLSKKPSHFKCWIGPGLELWYIAYKVVGGLHQDLALSAAIYACITSFWLCCWELRETRRNNLFY